MFCVKRLDALRSGIIAGLGRTCKSNISIVSAVHFIPLGVVVITPIPQALLADSTWYKNPGWGSIATTADKLEEFYNTDQLVHADPVLGSLDALNRLRETGYNLVIVTARSIPRELESTFIWVDKHFAGIFRHIVFSSQDSNTLTYDGRCIGTTLSKLQISEQMQSILLIDDSLETALSFGRTANRPVLLFGDYEWNKRVDTGDRWTYDDKLALEDGNEWWKGDTINLRSDDNIWRVRNWEEALQRLKVEVDS